MMTSVHSLADDGLQLEECDETANDRVLVPRLLERHFWIFGLPIFVINCQRVINVDTGRKLGC